MAKEEILEMQGVVDEVMPDARYRVTLENGHHLVAACGPDAQASHPHPGRRPGDAGSLTL